jgi:hypothetical protein
MFRIFDSFNSIVYLFVAGFQPLPFLGPYSVSKTALLGLTKVRNLKFKTVP